MIQLNNEQLEASRFTHGIACVIAVPGSGKTLTMTHRIKHLVQSGISPDSILGLTFTRNAAEEMRKRLKPILEDQAERVTLSTIHAWCHGLLKQTGRTYELVFGKDQMVLIKEVLKKLKLTELSPGMVLREISLAKNNMVKLDEFKALYEHDKEMLKVAVAFEAYDCEKQNRLMLDFDDLLVEAHDLVNNEADIRDRIKSRFLHIMVDEFQDTNPIQSSILSQLVGENGDTSYWVCGDDAQSIFGFTGASVGNILGFNEEWFGSQRFILSLNYRSTPQILKACQTLIDHNTRKIDKILRTDNPSGDEVVVLESSSEEGEALAVVNEISELAEYRGYDHKDIAVLYRANFQSRILEEIFTQHHVPYHIEKGLAFYDRHEVKALLDYLRVIVDSNSEAGNEALLNIINVPNRYIGRKFCEELKNYANAHGLFLYNALKSMTIRPRYLKDNVRRFTELLDSLSGMDSLTPAGAMSTLRASLDYDRWITDEDIPSPDSIKIQNINQLQMASARYSDIPSFLEYADTFKDADSQNIDGVRLMTIHKSKGMEFSVVFIVGLVEGITPTKHGDIEEERRIVFVGASRAMNALYLCHSLTYLGMPSKKSLFADELMGKA
jgi:DNA helicase-2/ATP-dependent DNA helicase PcrA